MSKKIGIIGSGGVAQKLGEGFLKYGYEVKLGTRSPEKLSEWMAEAGKGASVGSFKEAAQFGEIIVLAVVGRAAALALGLAGSANISGKTVIDATNPISKTPQENGVLNFFTGPNDSLMEQLQADFPAAHFVKAFNSVGSHLMVNPAFESKPTMFICGNEATAKVEVSEILDQFGWEIEDLGGVSSARAIEPLCMLWCIPGFNQNRWTHAFKLLK